MCGTAAATGGAKATLQQDSGEEIVQINARKKKSAAAARAPANPNAGSKVKLGMMDLMHPMPTTTPAVPLGGKTRFHTTFSDQVEMVEEYETQSDELVLRKWRSASILGAKGKWEYEIGEEERGNQGGGGGLFVASSANPSFHNRDTKGAWEWRVRNVPYPKEVYSITVEEETQQLVLRTSNKKYFKRFHIPAMRRHSQLLAQDAISWEHSNNTLVIQYDKPEPVIDHEEKARMDRKRGAMGGGRRR